MIESEKVLTLIELYTKVDKQAIHLISALLKKCFENDIKMDKAFMSDLDEYIKMCKRLIGVKEELTSL